MKNKRKGYGEKNQLKYSIIIPTFNRSKSLENCLFSVTKQSISKRNYEIIIIDDGSTDGTKALVETFRKKLSYNIIYIYQENAGCASARNMGIQNANGDILFFTDDDCILPYTWMEDILRGFEKHPHVVGVGGWYAVNENERKSNKYAKIFDRIDRTHYFNYEEYSVLSNNGGANPCGNTANVAYKREVFIKIGLFDTYTKRTAMIDYEFKLRIAYAGFYVLYIPLIIEHKKKVDFKEFISKPFRYGIADYYISTRYSGKNNTVKLKSLFLLLFEIKNQDRAVLARYYLLFLFVRLLGAVYARKKKIKSKAYFQYKDIHRSWLQEFNSGETQEQNFYTKEDYFYGRNFTESRKNVCDLLYKIHEVPIISIIIPFYNREQFITEHFILSLNDLEGDSTCAEIIIIDDGSTDGTLNKLQEIKSRVRFKVKIIHQENRGPAIARNVGITESLGEYLFFTDSDIIVPKMWFHWLLMPFFLNEKIGLTGGNQLNPMPVTYFDKWRNSIIDRKIFFQVGNLYTSQPYDTANLCVKKSRISNPRLLYFDTIFTSLGCEDLDYTLSMKKNGILSGFVPFSVTNMRRLDLKGFIKICTSRYDGMLLVRKKHSDLNKIAPHLYSKVDNNYYMLDTIFKSITRKKNHSFLLSRIYQLCINTKENNKIYKLLKEIDRRI